MSALKSHSSTPYEPKRGQGYAPESLTAGVNASVWGPSLEEQGQFEKSWQDQISNYKSKQQQQTKVGISKGFLEEG